MAETPTRRPEFIFHPVAFEPLTDYDAVMAFEIFLGRNPESSAVIEFHKSQSFPNTMAGCLASAEFADNVIKPIRARQPIRRGDYRRKPSDEQKQWLAHFIALDEAERAELDAAKNWSEFFIAFYKIGGVDLIPNTALQSARTENIDTILARLGQMRDLLADLETAVRSLQEK